MSNFFLCSRYLSSNKGDVDSGYASLDSFARDSSGRQGPLGDAACFSDRKHGYRLSNLLPGKIPGIDLFLDTPVVLPHLLDRFLAMFGTTIEPIDALVRNEDGSEYEGVLLHPHRSVACLVEDESLHPLEVTYRFFEDPEPRRLGIDQGMMAGLHIARVGNCELNPVIFSSDAKTLLEEVAQEFGAPLVFREIPCARGNG